MLVLMGHTKWPDNLGLLMPSETSLNPEKPSTKSSKGTVIQGSKSQNLSYKNSPTSQESQGIIRTSTTSPTKKKQRPPSGLFDILYDQSPTKSQHMRMSSDITSEKLKSPSYIEIEKAILAGHAFGGSHDNSYAHTVTMIEDKNLRRTGSVISKEAGLRYRNTIKRRNKIMKRQPIEQSAMLSPLVFSVDSKARKAGKPKRCKMLSIFPVKRRTSYKYYPVQKIDPNSRFNSQEDVDKHFLLNNITSLMKDILPSTMSTFEFKKIHHIHPLLESHPARFAISRDAQFTRLDTKPRVRTTSKVAFKDTVFEGNSNLSTTRSVDKTGSTQSEDPDLANRKIFLKEVYANYRKISFAGKRNIPLKMETVLPLESEMMTAAEREVLNTQILLEILLRRTLSAKIEFRIGQTRPRRVSASRNSSFSNAPSFSSSSSHSDSNVNDENERYDPEKNPKSGKRSNSRKDRSTPGPEEFSSLSEFLPSPQISFKSKLARPASPLFLQNENDTKSLHATDIHEGTVEKSPKERRTSNSLSSKTSLFPFSLHTLPSTNSTGISESHKVVRNYSLYDYGEYSRSLASDLMSDENSLGNVNLSLLRPVNRSHDTVSSSSLSEYVPGKDQFVGKEANVANSWSVSESSSASYGNHRTSSSTTNTSVSRDFHVGHLDKLEFSLKKLEVGTRKFILEFGSLRSQRSDGEIMETPDTVTPAMVNDDITTSYIPMVN